jgi:hypothetical protein
MQRSQHDNRVRDGAAARAVHARSCRAQAPPPAHAHAAACRPRVGGHGVRGAAAEPGWRCAGRRAVRRRRWPWVPALQATRHAPHARACRVRLGADGAAAGEQEAAELEQRRHAACLDAQICPLSWVSFGLEPASDGSRRLHLSSRRLTAAGACTPERCTACTSRE